MSNRSDFIQFVQVMQLDELKGLSEENNRLLTGISKKFETLLADSQREVFVANVFFAAEKILEILKGVANENDRLFLISQVGYLFTKDLSIAQQKTANIQTKRDIDGLQEKFMDLSTEISDLNLKRFNVKYKSWLAARDKVDNLRGIINNLVGEPEWGISLWLGFFFVFTGIYVSGWFLMDDWKYLPILLGIGFYYWWKNKKRKERSARLVELRKELKIRQTDVSNYYNALGSAGIFSKELIAIRSILSKII